jgi:anti-sigma regulatory factor (Ser/Thr protein kinase)
LPHDELAESGRGLVLLRAHADSVSIEPNAEGGTTVSVVFATPLALRRGGWRTFEG